VAQALTQSRAEGNDEEAHSQSHATQMATPKPAVLDEPGPASPATSSSCFSRKHKPRQ
jgi:hypothetical protein